MTLDQIEQLSAVRSQREGGQRLGTADSSPWQYHPEMASLAAVQQITVKIPALPVPAAATATTPAAAPSSSGGPPWGSMRRGGGGGGGAGAGAPAGAGPGAGAGVGPQEELYLTAWLLADGRELFAVHGAGDDEARVLEGLGLGLADRATGGGAGVGEGLGLEEVWQRETLGLQLR